MIFVKSFAAGAMALIAYVGLIFLFLSLRIQRYNTGMGVIVGPGWPLLIGALVVFSAAFVWAFTRFSR